MTDQQGARVIALLEFIAEQIAIVANPPEEAMGCQHPDDQRVSLSSFGDPEHWVCRLCRFDNKAAPA